MEHLQRRNQAEVLRELFDEETAGYSSEQKVLWLLVLFGDHIGRFAGVVQSLARPVDNSFFESDFVSNLLLVNALIQQEVTAIQRAEGLKAHYQIIASYLERLVHEKNDELIDGLIDLFEATKSEILTILK